MIVTLSGKRIAIGFHPRSTTYSAGEGRHGVIKGAGIALPYPPTIIVFAETLAASIHRLGPQGHMNRDFLDDCLILSFAARLCPAGASPSNTPAVVTREGRCDTRVFIRSIISLTCIVSDPTLFSRSIGRVE